MKSFRLLVIAIMLITIFVLPAKVAQAGGPSGTWASGIACQNLDNANLANVSLIFYPQLNGTSAITYNTTIAAGASKNWLTTSGVSMPGFPTNFVGSALITSDRAITCNVNSQSTGTGTTGDPYRIGTSAGLGSGQTASTIYIPQTIRRFPASILMYPFKTLPPPLSTLLFHILIRLELKLSPHRNRHRYPDMLPRCFTRATMQICQQRSMEERRSSHQMLGSNWLLR